MFEFIKARIADRDPNTDPVARIMQRWNMGPKSSVTYSDTMAANDAMRHIVTYRCLDKIATTFQGVGWYIERDPRIPKSFRTNRKTIDNLEEVFSSPNDEMNALQLRYWMALVFAVYGRVPFKVGMSTLRGVPNALYGLDPAKTKTEYNKSGQMFQMTFGNTDNPDKFPTWNKVSRDGNSVTGTPRDAYGFEIRKPGLSGCRDNINSPLHAVGLPASIIKLLMQRAHDTASGHPNTKYIISADKILTEPQRTDLRESTDSTAVGEDESGNVMIITGTNIKVDKLDNNLNDIHSKMPLDDMSRHIAGAWGVPVALLGFAGADGSKFANNYEESRLSFFEDTIIPGYCEPLCAGMSQYACPEGYVLRYDPDTIPALQERRAKRAKELQTITFLTDGEKREMCGFNAKKPIDPEPGDVNDGNED